MGEVLHVRVVFTAPVISGTVSEEFCAPEEAKATWQAFADWQTLQPTPVQPDSQEQPEEVKLAKELEAVGRGTRERVAPWKMLPPQPGCEHVEPPKPTGHAQEEPFTTP